VKASSASALSDPERNLFIDVLLCLAVSSVLTA